MEMKVNRELIKELRIQKSWSQETLADRAGISMRTIQRIETEGVASLQSRTAIAHALGVDPAVFLSKVPAQSDKQAASTQQNMNRNYELLCRTWNIYLKPTLRILVLSFLWVGMVTTTFLIFTTFVSGIFFWEGTSMTFWESAGGGLIGAATFIPILLLFLYAYRRITRQKGIEARS